MNRTFLLCFAIVLSGLFGCSTAPPNGARIDAASGAPWGKVEKLDPQTGLPVPPEHGGQP